MNKEQKKKPGKLRLLLIIAAVILILGTVISFAGGNFLVTYAIGRGGDGGNRTVALEVELPKEGIERIIAENSKLQQEKSKAFAETHEGEIAEITSYDGLNLAGTCYRQEDPDNHRWVISIHGYRSRRIWMIGTAQNYYEHGYNVLLPDLRACGDSEGSYIGMGWPDRKDILNWIDWVIAEDPDAQIVVYGISMGAATTMMTSGEETPDQVAAFVEDCGYTSVWDIFSSELKLRFHMPQFPLMYTASTIAKAKANYNFREASALNQVSQCEKPMMFIHGTSDDFIPYDMMPVLYAAKPGENKKMLTAEGAGHGQAMYVLGDTYWEEIYSFLDEYLR